MKNALLEVLHHEGYTSYQLMQHWTAIDIFCRSAKDLVGFGEVGYLAENVGKLLKGRKYVWNTLLLHCLDSLICVVHVTVTLSELIQNFLHGCPAPTVCILTLGPVASWS